MNPKHPEKGHPFCNQLNIHIRPDGSCSFCDEMFMIVSMKCELDQPIWSVVGPGKVHYSSLTYNQATATVKAAEPLKEWRSLCIVTDQAAGRMNGMVPADPERGRYIHIPR